MNHLPAIALIVFTTFIAPSAKAQASWKIFTHHNGFTIQLPAYFKKGLLVASGTLQYFDNSINKDISVSVEIFGMARQQNYNHLTMAI